METGTRYCKHCRQTTAQRWDGLKSGDYSFGHYWCLVCTARSGTITRDRRTGEEVEDEHSTKPQSREGKCKDLGYEQYEIDGEVIEVPTMDVVDVPKEAWL